MEIVYSLNSSFETFYFQWTQKTLLEVWNLFLDLFKQPETIFFIFIFIHNLTKKIPQH